MTPKRIILSAAAVAGTIGLSLGVASVASAATTTPTTTPSQSAKAPANAGAKGDCPNMGGATGNNAPSASGSGV